MNPAALLGMAAVGLGLFFLSGKSGGGGGSSPEPNPQPHIDPKPHPEPVSDCASTVQTIDGLEQAVLDELNADQPDAGRICATYNTYMMAVQAAQNGPCKDEIPATNIPSETAQQCSAPPQCQALLMAVMHDAAVLTELYNQDPEAQGDLCNAKKQLDASVAAAQAAGCTVQIPGEVPQFSCENPPYVPPGVDCSAEFLAYQSSAALLQQKLADWNNGAATHDDACRAYHAYESASAALVQKGCEVPASNFDPAQYGDPCGQVDPGKLGFECQKLAEVGAQFSDAVAQGDIATACGLQASYNAAYQAAVGAKCPNAGSWGPSAIDCSSGPGADCVELQRQAAALVYARNQNYPAAMAGDDQAAIDKDNSLRQQQIELEAKTQAAGCGAAIVSGWRGAWY